MAKAIEILNLPNMSGMRAIPMKSYIPTTIVTNPTTNAELPPPDKMTPFVITTASRIFSPAGTSSFLFIPRNFQAIIKKIRFRTQYDILCLDANPTPQLDFPMLEIRIGGRAVSDNPLVLLAAPGVGVAANQYMYHVLDRPDGIIECNYPLPPDTLITVNYLSRRYNTLSEEFIAGGSSYVGNIQLEGDLWTRPQ